MVQIDDFAKPNCKARSDARIPFVGFPMVFVHFYCCFDYTHTLVCGRNGRRSVREILSYLSFKVGGFSVSVCFLRLYVFLKVLWWITLVLRVVIHPASSDVIYLCCRTVSHYFVSSLNEQHDIASVGYYIKIHYQGNQCGVCTVSRDGNTSVS